MTIQSNTVLITGASRGLGANFSKVLAHDGFKIIGIGRNLQNLKSVISSLPNQDLGHSYLELDITDELQVQRMLKDLNIYALINNAGIANTKLLHEETYSDLTKIIDTNLLGSINVSNALIPNMIKNNVRYNHGDTNIPKHWDLSPIHQIDIKNIMKNHYKLLFELYEDDDLIIISDLDEIPDLEKFKYKSKITFFEQKMFYYKLNLLYDELIWAGSKAVKFKNFISQNNHTFY